MMKQRNERKCACIGFRPDLERMCLSVDGDSSLNGRVIQKLAATEWSPLQLMVQVKRKKKMRFQGWLKQYRLPNTVCGCEHVVVVQLDEKDKSTYKCVLAYRIQIYRDGLGSRSDVAALITDSGKLLGAGNCPLTQLLTPETRTLIRTQQRRSFSQIHLSSPILFFYLLFLSLSFKPLNLSLSKTHSFSFYYTQLLFQITN